MIIKHTVHKSKYDEPGFYITVRFMHGDADSYTTSEYFIPADEHSNTNIANFLYLCNNLEWDAYGQSKLIQRIAPCHKDGFYFEWPHDQTGYDGLAHFNGATFLYWDGKQLLDCNITVEDGDVDEHVKKLMAYWDYDAHAEADLDEDDEGWDDRWDQEAEEAWRNEE